MISSIILFLIADFSSSLSYLLNAEEYTLSTISFKVLPSVLLLFASSVMVTIIVPFSFFGKSLSGCNITTLSAFTT